MTPLALTIRDATKVSGMGRNKLFEEIAAKRLPAIKIGGRRLILTADLET